MWILSTIAIVGCSSRKSDPPPPAVSAVVPPAPPNAVGPMAAGKAPSPSPTTPIDPEEPDDEAPPGGPLVPHGPGPGSVDAGGVPL